MIDRLEEIRQRVSGLSRNEDGTYDLGVGSNLDTFLRMPGDVLWLLERVEELENAFKAYMRLVIFHESQTFLKYHKSTEFTEGELSIAQEIESEVLEEYRK